MTALAKFPRAAADADFAADVLRGLTSRPKSLPPKYFYDAAGATLFERITALPEYYPTRTELRILGEKAASIAALLRPGAALVEFGSGSSAKIRVLLRELRSLGAYVPVDICAEFLLSEAAALERDFPWLKVVPVPADFTKPFRLPPSVLGPPPLGFFPGSTIGNLDPEEARDFLGHAAQVLGDGAMLIVGVDLDKDPRILHAAYNDAAGVTAEFNVNLLRRINRELGADFDLGRFEHRAFYDHAQKRIEMHLVSLGRQRVRIGTTVVEFEAGETIHTENSYKYSVEGFQALARAAGWRPVTVWTDDARLFAVHTLRHDAAAR